MIRDFILDYFLISLIKRIFSSIIFTALTSVMRYISSGQDARTTIVS